MVNLFEGLEGSWFERHNTRFYGSCKAIW